MARRGKDEDEGIAAFLCEVGWSCPLVGWVFAVFLTGVAAAVYYLPWVIGEGSMASPGERLLRPLFAMFLALLAAAGALMALIGTGRCLLTGRDLLGRPRQKAGNGAAERFTVGSVGHGRRGGGVDLTLPPDLSRPAPMGTADFNAAPARGATRQMPKANPAPSRSPVSPGGAETTPACPICGQRMTVRKSDRGPFWGCSTYGQTKCRGIVRIAGAGTARA